MQKNIDRQKMKVAFLYEKLSMALAVNVNTK